jgi:hypothetical protein
LQRFTANRIRKEQGDNAGREFPGFSSRSFCRT